MTKVIAFVYTIVMLIVFWDETPVSYLIVMTVLLLVISATQFYSILVLRMLAVSVLLALTTLLPPSHPPSSQADNCYALLAQGRFSEQLKKEEITKTLRQMQKRLSADIENPGV